MCIRDSNSVLRPLFYMQDDKNIKLTFVNTYDEIEKNITSETKAVVINHISNVNGTIPVSYTHLITKI